ncbi:tRNA (guanine(9)-N1)-methyltransferase [Tritrichomonas foetus]|uniref:tRNA (guanine(9)-N(1))-methyltransferase n=1 Tax=Tritrichomonas foetus TaxID=1144522 RepID=A0A1J4KK57_9EUKA|nr:tRNA (guanine(9)-N1)-methyltransferase [Tritrichomonas foetus]|eukprot:OHT09733.1 tRNA (guanine(9)-N1)-methyltransferase [Tritrichomonas foetus]
MKSFAHFSLEIYLSIDLFVNYNSTFLLDIWSLIKSEYMSIVLPDQPIAQDQPQITPPQTKKSIHHRDIVVADGPKIIMDMSWGGLMNEHNQKKVIQQASYGYSINKKAKKSIPLIFTSVDQKWETLLNRVNAPKWSKDIVHFEKDSFIDIIPKEDIVYLTADTENVCKALDPSKCYVVGCLLDHNSKKGITHDFAVKNKIKMERLPIPEYIQMDGRHVLTINHVVEILVRVANGEDWGDALVNTIPSRKNPIKICEYSQNSGKEEIIDKSHSSNERNEITTKAPERSAVEPSQGIFGSWCNIY